MNALTNKIKEVSASVFPVTLIVLILHFTLTPLSMNQLGRFLIGATLLVIGLAIFLIGVDLSITPIGSLFGRHLIRSNKILILLIGGIFLGFLISIAEPDLLILAEQVDAVTAGIIGKMLLVVVVSIGVGLLVAIGMWRIARNVPLNKLLLVIYGIIAALAIFSQPDFLAISFDASGATTGAITVPFILALSAGIARISHSRSKDGSDSFGMVGLASAGAILAVLVQGLLFGAGKLEGSLDAIIAEESGILSYFFRLVPLLAKESLLSIAPLTVLFLAFNFFIARMKRRPLLQIVTGLVFSYCGLTIFMIGVHGGFMEIGSVVGYQIASLNQPWVLIVAGLFLGMVTILAEPAVHVLTNQIDEETAGHIPRRLVLTFLSVGVAIAVALSMLRILSPQIHLWHYLLPGYILSFILAFRVPDIFVGIAFDSGGVASGPMTATFILAFAQGAAQYLPDADVVIDGFGVIAMVAMTPLLALQILGVLFRRREQKTARTEDSNT